MKNIKHFIVLAAIAMLATACNFSSSDRPAGVYVDSSTNDTIVGNGYNMDEKIVEPSKHFVTESHYVGDFTGIEVSGLFTVNVKPGKRYSIKTTLPDNLMDYFIIKMDDDGMLEMKLDDSKGLSYKIKDSKKYVIDITTPVLNKIDVSGMVRFNVLDWFDNKDDDYKIEASGKTVVQVPDVTAKSLEIESSGMARVYVLNVEVDKLEIESSGMSSAEFTSVKAKTADVETSGEARVFATSESDIATLKKESSGMSSIGLR